MKKVGEHVTIDFLGVKKEYSPDFYNKVIYKIAKKAKIEVLNISEKVFKPQGYTCLALLAESHMSFHTFPERGIISFDFFTCGKISPTAALEILKNEIKHADLFFTADKIFLDKFLVPKVAYFAHFMSNPPATPTI